MPFFTAPARRLLVFCCSAVGLLLAASGCRSAQSAYQFRPAPTVVSTAQPATPTPLRPAVAPGPAAVNTAPVAVGRPVATRPARRAISPNGPAAPGRLARRLAAAAAAQPAYAAVVRPDRRSGHATDGAQTTAEVGLGTTVLGVLGLVVGPISLIGLLIWGGPVWAVLLGLSALAVLVAYIDPFW